RSRRRHTTFSRDWSSDVCSSDLIPTEAPAMSAVKQEAHKLIDTLPEAASWDDVVRAVDAARFHEAVKEGIAAADRGEFVSPKARSEELRVGKACRYE